MEGVHQGERERTRDETKVNACSLNRPTWPRCSAVLGLRDLEAVCVRCGRTEHADRLLESQASLLDHQHQWTRPLAVPPSTIVISMGPFLTCQTECQQETGCGCADRGQCRCSCESIPDGPQESVNRVDLRAAPFPRTRRQVPTVCIRYEEHSAPKSHWQRQPRQCLSSDGPRGMQPELQAADDGGCLRNFTSLLAYPILRHFVGLANRHVDVCLKPWRRLDDPRWKGWKDSKGPSLSPQELGAESTR